jgi:hypothetical protein
MGPLLCSPALATLLAVGACALPAGAENESEPIGLSDGLVERSGDLLTIHARDGSAVTFRNEQICGENGGPFDSAHCVQYCYVGYDRARHGLLILAAAYEETSFVWVSDVAGARTDLHGEPKFSPDGQLFITTAPNELGWNGIQAGKWSPGGLSLQWEFQPKAYALYDFSSWLDAHTVALRETTWKDGALVELPATLVWTQSGWNLRPR